MVANKEKLLVAFEELKLNKLKQSEWAFLDEYCATLEPLAKLSIKYLVLEFTFFMLFKLLLKKKNVTLLSVFRTIIINIM